MPQRFCPECETRTDEAVCPACGLRTLRERAPESRVDPLLGRVLEGRYRIDEIIGRGGMGAVYKGVQLATEQTVAIKVILSEHSENVDAVRRFHREARAASLLSHPHSIRVIDFGQAEDCTLYMVLEFLAGRTLAKVLHDEGAVAERRVAKIAGEIGQTLAEAHAVGLVHRDLKPENVMLLDVTGDADFVKVLDFGIAKMVAGSGEAHVTRTGSVVGTPHYMAPELAQGRSQPTTGAIDVYALGVMCYQALSGSLPFDGDSPLKIVFSHVQSQVPVLAPELLVSDGMRRLVERMLAKDPAARPTAAELVKAFERLREGHADLPLLAPAPGAEAEAYAAALQALPNGRRLASALVIAGALVVALGVGAVLWLRSPREVPAVTAPIASAPVVVAPTPVAPPPAPEPLRPEVSSPGPDVVESPAEVAAPAPEVAPAKREAVRRAPIRSKPAPVKAAPAKAAPTRSKYRALE
jgi:serine/threonine-protein kinase